MKTNILNRSRFALNITGFCPDENDRYPNFSYFKRIIVCFCTLLLLFFTIYSTFKLTSNTVSMAKCAGFCIVYFLISLKCVLFCLYRKDILFLLKDTRKRLNQKMTISERRMMKLWQSYETRISKFFIISYISVFIAYITTPLFLNERKLPQFGYYSPFLLTSPWYEICYVGEVIAFFIILNSVLVLEILGIFFVFHLCYEMNCAALMMRKFGKKTGKRAGQFKEAILRYNDAYDYGKNVCSLLSIIYYIDSVACSLAVCIAGTILLKTSSKMIASKVTVSLISLLVHQIINCFVGEMVTTENLKVSSALQKSNWYELHDKKDVSSLILIILRDQKPLRLVVGTQCVVNVKALGENLRWACSYMMVLKSLISKDFAN